MPSPRNATCCIICDQVMDFTGGPWYTEMEFDHEFMSILRTFVMNCVRRLNKGKGSKSKIAGKIKLAKYCDF